MELVKVENGIIEVANDVILELNEFQKQKEVMELKEKKIKQAILDAMEKNEIKSFENDLVKITYIEPTTRKTVDSKALKEQGLYDMFLKESKVKASVKMSWK